MRLFQKINTLIFTIRALIISGYVRFALSFLPHRIVKKMMGPVSDQVPSFIKVDAGIAQKIRRVTIAIARVKKVVPWNMECYTQALTAKILLQRYDISSLLLIGFRKDDAGTLQGHAWLKYDDVYITGYAADIESYTVNGRFF